MKGFIDRYCLPLKDLLSIILNTLLVFAILTYFYPFFLEYLLFQKWVPMSIRALRPILCLALLHVDLIQIAIYNQFLLLLQYSLLFKFHGYRKQNWGLTAVYNRFRTMLSNALQIRGTQLTLNISLFALFYSNYFQTVLLFFLPPHFVLGLYTFHVFHYIVISLLTFSILFPKAMSSDSLNPRFRSILWLVTALKFYFSSLCHIPIIKFLFDISSKIGNKLLLSLLIAHSLSCERKWQSSIYSDDIKPTGNPKDKTDSYRDNDSGDPKTPTNSSKYSASSHNNPIFGQKYSGDFSKNKKSDSTTIRSTQPKNQQRNPEKAAEIRSYK